MNDNELKNLWQQQPLRNPPSATQLISAMKKETGQFRRHVNARDFRELAVCAVMAVVFGVLYFTVYREPTSRIGVLIIIAGLIFIAWKLIHTRRKTEPAPAGATLVESLRAELKSVRAQSGLLGSVLWWYLLPLTVGEIVVTWGLPISLAAKLTSVAMFLAINGFVYWLNQRARRSELLPMQARLEALIRSAETGEPVDATHVAKLRPIVISLATADQVKPVEFKVAFWQLALWGEVGFIGIWFFLMLGLPMREEALKIPETSIEPAAQNISTEETNRYTAVAQKVINLFNAGNFAGVHQLYNASMSRAFPLKETVRFYSQMSDNVQRIDSFVGPTRNGHADWIAFRLDYQRGTMTMSLALDDEDRISGIHFKPAPRSPVNMVTLARRIFHWQRLIWLPLFFLAGLLYSRWLQKKTERAVGVSALGIHLHQGHNVILWEEIKDVQTLRILNIRSLYLIKDPGEKTIMPWTSLERPAELKAAVERFAPPGHPLLNHLRWLR